MTQPVRVKRVSIAVYCRADEANDVAVSLSEWFKGNDYELWKPVPVRVDDLNNKQASRWFTEMDAMCETEG